MDTHLLKRCWLLITLSVLVSLFIVSSVTRSAASPVVEAAEAEDHPAPLSTRGQSMVAEASANALPSRSYTTLDPR